MMNDENENHKNNSPIPTTTVTDSKMVVRTRTLQWIRRIVIGLNLCPFALQPYQNQQIKIVVVQQRDRDCDRNRQSCGDGNVDTNVDNDADVDDYNYDDHIIRTVQTEIDLLVQSTGSTEAGNNDINDSSSNIPTTTTTTTLIVCPDCYPNDFLSYLNIVHDIEDIIEENDAYTGIVQLASFHPQYCFDGSSSATKDPDNCTNQSPYPTFHLLREMDVTHVVDTALPNQDSSIVWSRNVDLLRTLHEELSETEFTSVLTIPLVPALVPAQQPEAPEPSSSFVSEKESNHGVINTNNDAAAPLKVTTNKDLIFRVRQILRRFPITLLRNSDDK